MQFFTRKCCFVGLPMDSTLFLFGRAPKAYTNTKLLNLHMTMCTANIATIFFMKYSKCKK